MLFFIKICIPQISYFLYVPSYVSLVCTLCGKTNNSLELHTKKAKYILKV